MVRLDPGTLSQLPRPNVEILTQSKQSFTGGMQVLDDGGHQLLHMDPEQMLSRSLTLLLCPSVLMHTNSYNISLAILTLYP